MSFDRNPTRDREPPSPFRYASKLDLHAKLPSPPEDGIHSRHAIRPRSLAQAYRDASRNAMAAPEENFTAVTTPSPQQKRQSYNALSPYQLSPPPYELQDAYNQIHEGEQLSDYVRDQDSERPRNARRPASRNRQTSFQFSATSGRSSEQFNPDTAFGGDLGEYKTQKTRDYTKDEERLRRATGQHSPVFSKAQVGRDSSRADNWRRRREAEAQVDNNVSEDDGNLGPSGPSPNLPSGWGYRAGHRQEWGRKVSPPSGNEHEEEQNPRSFSPRPIQAGLDKRTRTSPRSPARNNLSTRNALEERPFAANMNKQEPQQGLGIREPVPGKDSSAMNGEQIPNSPITIYKSSTFARPSPSKRDSRDLLRSLSRSESHKADQVQTPEPPKLFERKVYDKTPRVTGAWIDTPMTQRVSEKIELPEDLTKDIVLPRTNQEPNDTEPAAKPTENASKVEAVKPVQNAAETEPLPDQQPTKSSRAPLPRPNLPKSALETVIEDASSGKEADFGDDTIESLQAMMDGPSEIKIEEQEDDEAYEKAVIASFEKTALEEPYAVNLDSLNIKLNSLTKNINEVQKGLNGLEALVTQDVEISSQANSPIESKPSTHIHAGESCKGCGAHSDGRLYASIRLPRLLERSPRSQRLRPTKLLYAIMISLCWWVIECLMSDHFSYFDVSEPCDGYCLQPDAPEYPWVTVTMLWRWSHLSAILTPILAICMAFSRILAQLSGLSDGYVDDLPELSNIVGEIRINGTPVAFPWLSAPTAANIEPQPPQLPQMKQPLAQQPVQPPKYVRPPPDAYTPRWDSDLPSTDDGMDDDEYV